VRIHLDTVADLGDFLEFEAVAPATSDLLFERGLVAELRRALAVEESDLIESSYSDLMLAIGS
jgi:adenylate cyclase, class 2